MRSAAAPERVRIDGAGVTEAVMVQDFEGVMEWVVGLEGEAPFASEVMTGPTRFALDVAHP